MKRVFIALIVCILAMSAVAAKGPDGADDMGQSSGASDSAPDNSAKPENTGQDMEKPVETQEQNAGQDNQIQNQVETGNPDNGQQAEVRTTLQAKNGPVNVGEGMQIVQNQEKLTAKLSNGRNAEIKIMPDAASEKAMEMLQLKACDECQIELKEVGQGEQTRAVYEVRTQKESRVFGLFKTQMQVQARIDAENGEVVQTKKPWWAFLASE